MTWRVERADCLEAMRGMDEASVDAVVCDPPYGIRFMGQAWDAPGVAARVESDEPGDHTKSRGRSASMHAGEYDLSLTASQAFGAWCREWAALCLRVLKPGGHLLAGAEREVVGVKADPRYQSPRRRSVFAPERGGSESGTAGLGHGDDSPAALLPLPPGVRVVDDREVSHVGGHVFARVGCGLLDRLLLLEGDADLKGLFAGWCHGALRSLSHVVSLRATLLAQSKTGRRGVRPPTPTLDTRSCPSCP